MSCVLKRKDLNLGREMKGKVLLNLESIVKIMMSLYVNRLVYICLFYVYK